MRRPKEIDLGDAVQRRDHPGQDVIERAAEIPGAQTQRDSHRQIEKSGREADEEGYLAAVKKSHHLAASDLVGAQQVREVVELRLFVRVEEILLLELVMEHVLGEEGRGDGERRKDEEYDERADRQLVAPELVERVVPETPRGPR